MLCVVCPYCHLQFDRVQRALFAERGVAELPTILFHQLLGLSLGIAPEALGLAPGRQPLVAVERAAGNGARHA